MIKSNQTKLCKRAGKPAEALSQSNMAGSRQATPNAEADEPDFESERRNREESMSPKSNVNNEKSDRASPRANSAKPACASSNTNNDEPGLPTPKANRDKAAHEKPRNRRENPMSAKKMNSGSSSICASDLSEGEKSDSATPNVSTADSEWPRERTDKEDPGSGVSETKGKLPKHPMPTINTSKPKHPKLWSDTSESR